MKSSRKDMLIENYEDATFALLMDNMMEADGEKWLEENERLKDDPNFCCRREWMSGACVSFKESNLNKSERLLFVRRESLCLALQ